MCTFTCTHVHISMYIQCAPLHALLCACLWTPLHTTTCNLCALILYTTSLCHASLNTIGLFRLFINAKKKKLVLFSVADPGFSKWGGAVLSQMGGAHILFSGKKCMKLKEIGLKWGGARLLAPCYSKITIFL